MENVLTNTRKSPLNILVKYVINTFIETLQNFRNMKDFMIYALTGLGSARETKYDKKD